MSDQPHSQPHDDLQHGVTEVELARQVDEVTGALEGLTQALDQAEGLPLVLQRCCQQVINAIPGADLASVTLLRDSDPYTAAMTGDEAGMIDEAQYRSGEGPCLEAAKTGTVVRTAVADAALRWPKFTRPASKAGLRSYLSAPLYINHDYSGSLNLYGLGTDGFRQLDAALLELYTTAAEAALRADLRYRKARDHVGRLTTALGSRAVIDQAKGIIMAVRQVDADTAFAALVELSQRDHRELRDVAEQFVADITQPRG